MKHIQLSRIDRSATCGASRRGAPGPPVAEDARALKALIKDIQANPHESLFQLVARMITVDHEEACNRRSGSDELCVGTPFNPKDVGRVLDWLQDNEDHAIEWIDQIALDMRRDARQRFEIRRQELGTWKAAQVPKITKSSGNVYKDIGVKNPKAMLTKSGIVFQIMQALTARDAGRKGEPTLARLAGDVGLETQQIAYVLRGHFQTIRISVLKKWLAVVSAYKPSKNKKTKP